MCKGSGTALQCHPRQLYSEASPNEFNGTYSQINAHRMAALVLLCLTNMVSSQEQLLFHIVWDVKLSSNILKPSYQRLTEFRCNVWIDRPWSATDQQTRMWHHDLKLFKLTNQACGCCVLLGWSCPACHIGKGVQTGQIHNYNCVHSQRQFTKYALRLVLVTATADIPTRHPAYFPTYSINLHILK